VRFRRKATLTLFGIAAVVLGVTFLGPRAQRPGNTRMVHYHDAGLHQFERLELRRGRHEDLIVLAFSGGGTRAAAFAYGVLEALRRIELVTKEGEKLRLLDEVDVITGVSGGSFPALAYGLYGDAFFGQFETQFLKRDIQGELFKRFLNPLNWSRLASSGWGRSDMAADLYDEILFHGSTFADLERAGGPAIAVGATDLGTGARVVFMQQNFDVMCSELADFRIARAAASSSAVPGVLSPITINNYGGSCGYDEPEWLRHFSETANPPRPAGRILKRLAELRDLAETGADRYLHLVDGAISDNLGLRGVLDYLETFEALRASGQPTPLDHVKRIIVFVVNSVSAPSFDWNESENPPRTLTILMKSAGVPIERYANESIELLKDIDARWTTLRRVRDEMARSGGTDSKLTQIENAPDAEIHPIEVSFQALRDPAERAFLNELPTSFHLPDEAIDRLRAAAETILLDSKELREALKDEWRR
jgi:NTE family protein